jgi:hypothetical protein
LQLVQAVPEEKLFYEVLPDAGFVYGSYTWGAPSGSGAPRVQSASGSNNVVLVTFDRDMRINHPTLGRVLDPQSYQLTEVSGGRRLFVVRAEKVNETTVALHTEYLEAIQYQVFVQFAQALSGEPVDPAFDTVQFTGVPHGFPVGNTLHSFWGFWGGLQADVEVDFEPDINPPVLSNQIPPPGAGNQDVAVNVQLDITDTGEGLDANSVIIEINGGKAWENDAQQAGFAVTKTPITDGFQYLINPDVDFPDDTIVSVRVRAADLAPLPNLLDETYTFNIFIGTGGPDITQQAPGPDATGVDDDKAILFSVIDDKQVVLSSVNVWFDDVLVFDGTNFQPGFLSSPTPEANSENGYDFAIVPDTLPFEPGSAHSVRVQAQDELAQQVDETWMFAVADLEEDLENPFSIYRMLLRSIRTMDERSPGTLQKLLQGFEGEDNGVDQIWNDLILDPQRLLNTLFDPAEVDAKWLPWLKSIVGFTRDLNFTPSELELRRVIENGVAYWNAKPSTNAINRALRMTTGNRFRLRDYFKLRMQADQTSVTEELADFDPNVLDFGQAIPVGSQFKVDAADDSLFEIDDLPGDLASFGFASEDQFLFLQVLEGPNAGTYVIRVLTQGASDGQIDTTLGPAFPDTGDSANPRAWRLIGEAAEFTQELRVVDEGHGEIDLDRLTTPPTPGDTIIGVTSGARALVESVDNGALGTGTDTIAQIRNLRGRFVAQENFHVNAGPGIAGRVVAPARGVLNTDLLTFLLEQIRPVGERIDVVLIDFIDQFFMKGDLEQWTPIHLSGGTSDAEVAEGTGYAQMTADSAIVSGEAGDFMDDWFDQTTAWLVQAGAAGSVLQGHFFAQDATLLNSYYWELDYNLQVLRLFKIVAGGTTQLGGDVALPFLFELQQDTVRIDLLRSGGTTTIRVRVDGELFIEETDSQWSSGRIGFATITGTGRLLLAEVNTIPTLVLRVGPR